MNIYFDTSSILAYWIPNEIDHKAMREMITNVSLNFQGYISGLVLAEVASVVERQYKKFHLKNFNNLGLEYCKAILKLQKITLIDPELTQQRRIVTYSLFSESIANAELFKLKTLDNLHLSIISLLKQQDNDIKYFISGDREILEKSDLIKEKLNLTPMTPANFLDILS